MKLLVLSFRYPPYVGGGYEILTHDAVRGLRARGHEIVVLTARGKEHQAPDVRATLGPDLDGEQDPFQRSFEAGNAERFGLHFFSLANYRATRRAIEAEQPDAVLGFNQSLLSLGPLLAARHAEVPTLTYVADPWPLNHWVLAWRQNVAPGARSPWGLEILSAAWRAFRERVSLGPLCVCSEFLRAELVRDGIPVGDCDVVPLALSPELEERARAVEPGVRKAQDPLRVLCLSSLWRGKGQDVLLRAVARASDVPLELTLAGGEEPDFGRSLRELATELGIAGRVHFRGTLPRAELDRELAQAHVLAMPSVWGEPFGLATIEGMAFGLAVVGSDAGATPELVRHKEDGWIVPAGDADALAGALRGLAGDEHLRSYLGQSARDTAWKRFASARFVDDLQRALEARVGPDVGNR